MQEHVRLAVSSDFDQVHARRAEGFADGGAELIRVFYAAVGEVVHLGRVSKVQSMRRAEQLLEVLALFSLRQEGEDAAAVVVQQDDGRAEIVALGASRPFMSW